MKTHHTISLMEWQNPASASLVQEQRMRNEAVFKPVKTLPHQDWITIKEGHKKAVRSKINASAENTLSFVNRKNNQFCLQCPKLLVLLQHETRGMIITQAGKEKIFMH